MTEYFKRQIVFGGEVYENENTATSDAARTFEADTKKLRFARFQVSTNNQLFGTATSQRFLATAGGYFCLRDVDLSTLYFKNAAAGSNGTVNILGTEE
jgi:hypothetical protein